MPGSGRRPTLRERFVVMQVTIRPSSDLMLVMWPESWWKAYESGDSQIQYCNTRIGARRFARLGEALEWVEIDTWRGRKSLAHQRNYLEALRDSDCARSHQTRVFWVQ
jgi:hypothetical protein